MKIVMTWNEKISYYIANGIFDNLKYLIKSVKVAFFGWDEIYKNKEDYEKLIKKLEVSFNKLMVLLKHKPNMIAWPKKGLKETLQWLKTQSIEGEFPHDYFKEETIILKLIDSNYEFDSEYGGK